MACYIVANNLIVSNAFGRAVFSYLKLKKIMQNNESFSTMDTTQASETTVLSEALKEELTENISTIKKILKNNPDFFEELILKCMEVSTKKHVYMSDVKELLYQ